MSKLFNLVKVNLPDYLGLFEIAKKKGLNNKLAVFTKTLLLCLLYLLIGYFIYKLASNVVGGFKAMNLTYLVIGEFFSIGSLFIFFFNIYKSDIYNVSEYEMLISMPIKKGTIILSKVIIIYINSLMLSCLFMIPTLITYSNYAIIDIGFILRFALGTIFMPLFPSIMAILITSIITSISSKFKYQKLIQTILLFLLTMGLTYLSFKVSNINNLDIFHMETSFNNFFNSMYPLNKYFLESLLNTNILSTIIFYGVSLISVVTVTTFLSLNYNKVINKIHNNQFSIYKKRIKAIKYSKYQALFLKEAKKFLSNPYYIINSIMSLFILLIFSIIINFIDISSLGIPISNNFLAQKLPLIFIFVILLSCTTSVSISLESKNYYILRSAPLKSQEIFFTKILFNQVLIIPITLISLVIFNLALPIAFSTNLVTVISILVFSLFIGTYGLFINLVFPLKNWKSESKVLNNSLSPFLTIYSGIIFGLIIILNKLDNFIAYILLVNLIIFIITLIIFLFMVKNDKKLLSKIL